MQLTTLPSARDPKATGGNRTHNLRFTKPLHYRCATVASLREPITIRRAKIADKTSAMPRRDFTAVGNLGEETTKQRTGFRLGAVTRPPSGDRAQTIVRATTSWDDLSSKRGEFWRRVVGG